MRDILKGALFNISFFTILPIGSGLKVSGIDIGNRLIILPVVGLIIGLILAVLNLFFSVFLPATVSDALIVVFLVIITGGLHIDGVADTFDGFFSGRDREKILAIMKDSHIGPFGVTAIFSVLMIKFLSLNSLDNTAKCGAIVSMVVISRWSVIVLGFLSKYARPDYGIGKLFTGAIGRNHLLISSFITFIISVKAAGHYGVIIMFVAALITVFMSLWSYNKIGGVTGDIFGAVIEINEMSILIIYSALV